MTKRPHVALIVETSIHYGRQVLRGVTRYLRSHQAWSVFLEQRELWTEPPPWLVKWRGDGVICRKTTPQLAQMLARAGVPLDRTIVVYCHIGQTANVVYSQIRRLGLPVKLYDGSFQDWSLHSEFPVVKGVERGTP